MLLVVAALVLGFATASHADTTSRSQPAGSTDITFGPTDAGKVLIEYSDFQCQFCAGYSQILSVLREEYADKVLFVFRFFPLDNHPYSLIAAQAAYAAYLQGGFWEMHDLLFEGQEDWAAASDPTVYFDAYAQTLGLDVEQFREDMRSDTTLDFILAQKQEGQEAGVEHTPWFVIDGEVAVPLNLEDFQTLLESTP